MPRLFEHDVKGLLVFATLLEGCGYYGCKDDLKREYVPGGESWYRQVGSSSWRDAQTLEVSFGAPLRPPTEVDPQRFALLRYNVKFDGAYYYCHFDLCYRELEVEAIPESLDWDPADPEILRLHFAEPIPASSCEPWKGNRADFQALELIYLGVEEEESGTDTGGNFQAEPDQLAYADDQGVEAIGPDRARSWLAACAADGSCELDEFCIDRDSPDWEARDLWVDCP